MQITNNANLPAAIVEAVTNDPYPHGRVGDISATSLIDAPRIRVLRRRHADEITEDAAERIWALLGQAVHTILERAEPSAVTERRLYAEVDGWQISGQFDRAVLYPESGLLQDYKVTSAWAVVHGLKPEWARQLNVLRWLALHNGYPVTRLQIVALLRDWSRGKAAQGGGYPQQQVAVIEVPVWAEDELEAYVRERVRIHQAAEQAQHLPECTPEERWQRPTTYAVMRKGRKSAIRVLEDPEAAAQRAEREGGYVETRPGRAVRCDEYCPVREFCDQVQPSAPGEEAA